MVTSELPGRPVSTLLLLRLYTILSSIKYSSINSYSNSAAGLNQGVI